MSALALSQTSEKYTLIKVVCWSLYQMIKSTLRQFYLLVGSVRLDLN